MRFKAKIPIINSPSKIGSIKDGLCGQHFPDIDLPVTTNVKQWVASVGADFYKRSVQDVVFLKAKMNIWDFCSWKLSQSNDVIALPVSVVVIVEINWGHYF